MTFFAKRFWIVRICAYSTQHQIQALNTIRLRVCICVCVYIFDLYGLITIDQKAKEIPIKKVNADILKLIVEYLKHHDGKVPQEIAKPIRSVKMERIVDDRWDAQFIDNMSKKTIFQVILGANYMDLPSLLHLGCAKIATLIKGKSPEEIKNILADDSDQGAPAQQEQKSDV